MPFNADAPVRPERKMENPHSLVYRQFRRFGELRRQIGEITQSTLTKQLRELEDDGFISRTIYQEIPPKVEYTLTEMGKSFIPLLENMMDWSQKHLCAG